MEKSGETKSFGDLNEKAEWAALKHIAGYGGKFDEVRGEMTPEEREKIRQWGEWFLKVIENMPGKMDEEKLEKKVAQVHRIAEQAGFSEVMEKAVRRDLDRGDYAMHRPGASMPEMREPLTEEEAERMEKLAEKVMDMTEMEPEALSAEFPSGTYLYHGSERAEQILESGELLNAVGIAEKTDGFVPTNSGAEGISWSMNGIDALPGKRGHIAGFLAAPEDVLGDDKLVVSSRPAPYEMLQVNEKVNAPEFYAAKKQVEVWGDRGISVGEIMTVDSNLMATILYDENSLMFSHAALFDFAEKGGKTAEELRKHYNIAEDGTLTLDEELHQQEAEEEIPPAAVYMQALLDEGRFKDEWKDVNEIILALKDDKILAKKLVAAARGDSEKFLEKYKTEFKPVEKVSVPVSEMYFVTSHRDLPDWLKVMAKTGAEPKGILLYDDKEVVVENFASETQGNNKELAAEFDKVIGTDEEFWTREMGMEVEKIGRTGSYGQVLKESEVLHDKEAKIVGGKLEVVPCPTAKK